VTIANLMDSHNEDFDIENNFTDSNESENQMENQIMVQQAAHTFNGKKAQMVTSQSSK